MIATLIDLEEQIVRKSFKKKNRERGNMRPWYWNWYEI